MSSSRKKEDIVVKISALQHYSYCPRQCALIYLENTYDENIYTLQGSDIHERVHEEYSKPKADRIEETALMIWSQSLGLRGQADLVEFYPKIRSKETEYDKIVPVEYKRGPKHRSKPDEIQLCAQALCLEEMFDATINEAYIFQFASQTRRRVELDSGLRQITKGTIEQVRKMLVSRTLPPPANDKRCQNCSLKESCLPEYVGSAKRIEKYSQELFRT